MVRKGYEMGYPNPIRWWSQGLLPLTFDESLSYYEVVAKCTNYINNIIEDLQNIEDQITSLDIEHITEIVAQMEQIIEALPPEEVQQLVDDVDTLKGDVNTLKNKVQTNEANILALDGRLTDVNAQVQTNKSDIAQLVTKTNTLEIDVNELKAHTVDGRTIQLTVVSDFSTTAGSAGFVTYDLPDGLTFDNILAITGQNIGPNPATTMITTIVAGTSNTRFYVNFWSPEAKSGTAGQTHSTRIIYRK